MILGRPTGQVSIDVAVDSTKRETIGNLNVDRAHHTRRHYSKETTKIVNETESEE